MALQTLLQEEPIQRTSAKFIKGEEEISLIFKYKDIDTFERRATLTLRIGDCFSLNDDDLLHTIFKVTGFSRSPVSGRLLYILCDDIEESDSIYRIPIQKLSVDSIAGRECVRENTGSATNNLRMPNAQSRGSTGSTINTVAYNGNTGSSRRASRRKSRKSRRKSKRTRNL
jgi:hypothetical protein